MPNLQDYTWQCKYTPANGNLLQTFYIPALSCAVRYDRTTGFFSARTLAAATTGVEGLVANKGHMRLICGCTLEQAEIHAILLGQSLKETVEARLLRTPFPDSSQAQESPETSGHDRELHDGLELLAWMIARGFLDIRIAVPCDPVSGRFLASQAIFHEKAGIIEDAQGDRLVFNGSLNETLAGWTQNWDTFHVFRSWKDDAAHLDADEASFQALWENRDRTARVLELGCALRNRLLAFLPQCSLLPVRLRPEKPDDPAVPEDTAPDAPGQQDKDLYLQTWQTIREAPRISPGGDRVGEATAAVVPWPHQQKTFLRMYRHWPPKLLIADEVGLGKTVQAGLLIRQAWLSGRARRILILAPKAVLLQWQLELREKFNLNIPVYDDGCLHWYPSPGLQGREQRAVSETDWYREPLLLASSHLMRRRERSSQLLNDAEPWDLVVLDEAHHARRKDSARGPEHNIPNQLLRLMRGLRKKTGGLLLLTATPMQVHPIEVWDLLDLMDLPGEWNAANFLKFFDLLTHASPGDQELAFLRSLFQAMEAHFAPMTCEEAQHIVPGQSRIALIKVLKALHDTSLIPLSMLTAGERRLALRLVKAFSPTRLFISRHTRELLRHYHRQGRLGTNIATRKVEDLLIDLSAAERTLYEAVEDYISRTYDKASMKERTAVGFIMTIYRRRLASSFHALASTLQNRLSALRSQDVVLPQFPAEDLSQDELEEQLQDTEEAALLERRALKAEEASAIRELLEAVLRLPADSKVQTLVQVLADLERQGYQQVIVFTQYTDSLDFLREQLVRNMPSSSILCFSGRGGERRIGAGWEHISREQTKQLFREGAARFLLCTDAAAEGLNFQFCGALINYDMPWNPMRVEQRIGRIDRLGQAFETIRIVNLMYADTVETDIYQALRQRIGLFSAFVGKLQPILSRLPQTIGSLVLKNRTEQAAARERVLVQLNQDIQQGTEGGFDLDDLTQTDLEDVTEVPPSYDLAFLHKVLTTPSLLPPGHEAIPLAGGRDFKYVMPGMRNPIRVTTDPVFYEEHAESLELWSPGSPAFPWNETL